MQLKRFGAIALLGSSLICGTVSATVVYDTLGPTNSFLTASWIVGNTDGDTPTAYNYTSADYFTPTSSGYLSSLTAPVVLLPFSVSSPIQYTIRADDGGKPGAILASAQVPLSTSSKPTLYTALFSGATFLSSSTSYWLALSATYAGTAASWQVNAIGAKTQHAFTGTPFLASGQWQVSNDRSGAARIEVISAVPAVPEVSEAWMLLLGAPLLMVVARKRSKI